MLTCVQCESIQWWHVFSVRVFNDDMCSVWEYSMAMCAVWEYSMMPCDQCESIQWCHVISVRVFNDAMCAVWEYSMMTCVQDPQPTHPVQSLITFFLCGWFITGLSSPTKVNVIIQSGPINWIYISSQMQCRVAYFKKWKIYLWPPKLRGKVQHCSNFKNVTYYLLPYLKNQILGL